MSASAPASVTHPFRSLRHRNFRIFWYGQLVSLIGTWMQAVAQGWLMHRLTSSPMMLGALGFAQFVPSTFFSLWAGVVADHVDKRKLLIVTQALALLQAVVLATLVVMGRVEPWMVLALALLYGAINAFDLPARQSVLVEMVGRDDLTNAIALNSAVFNVARILGPAIAGVLLVAIGEAGCFWINAVSYVPVIVGLAMIRLPERAETGRAPRGSLAEGVRYARNTTSIRNLLVLLAVCGGLGFQFSTLLPVYARDIFQSDAKVYGNLMSSFGVGSLIAALSMTRVLDRWALRRNLLIGLVGAGAGLAVFAWSRSLPLTYVMGMLSGYGLILYVASTNTLIQITTEDRYRGRVMSLYTFMFVGTTPVGALLSGAIAERFGAPVASSVCALILLGGALWVSARLRELRAAEARTQENASVPPVDLPR